MKIVFLYKYNPYWTYEYFTEQLNQAFRRKGYEPIVLDFDADERRFAQCVASDEPTLFITFILLVNQPQVMEVLKPQHKWLFLRVDPIQPCRQYIQPHDQFYISIVDQFEKDYIKTFLQSDHVEFIPHGVDPSLKSEDNADRPIDVLFCATSYDHQSVDKKIHTFNPSEQRFIYSCIDRYQSDGTRSINDLLVEINPALRTQYHALIDHYIRAKHRLDLVRSIRDATIHIYGGTGYDSPSFPVRGWAELLRDQPNVVIHPALRFSESLDLMRSSKIVLNSMPFFRNGTHERVFNSLALGAVPLTDKNHWFEKYFINHEEVIFYQMETVNQQINELLDDEDKRRRIVKQGREKVMRDHTWDRRVEQIISWLVN